MIRGFASGYIALQGRLCLVEERYSEIAPAIRLTEVCCRRNRRRPDQLKLGNQELG